MYRKFPPCCPAGLAPEPPTWTSAGHGSRFSEELLPHVGQLSSPICVISDAISVLATFVHQ
jgi:hypothetical protein